MEDVDILKLKGDRKVTTIVPTYNEGRFISQVVKNIPKDVVDEILIVDGYSYDETVKTALRDGADRIVYQKGDGKGNALKTGLQEAKGDVIVFWDGDIISTKDWMFTKILVPVLTGDADFVKVNYSKTPGRVACLTAIPLAKRFFPEMARFGQPLSGEVAFRRNVLNDIQLESHYGVEIGLLIDTLMKKHRVKEVDLEIKKHKHKVVRRLTPMADQILETIFDRAKKYGRLSF